MSLALYMHPLASYCWKALIALYENGTPFEPIIVDLGNEASRAVFGKVWPLLKFPVLHDRARDRIVPESATLIEYLAQHYPGSADLVPRDPDLAREARLFDRLYDGYVQEPMQKIVTDRLRPAEKRDAYGVEQAKASLLAFYGYLDREMAAKTWSLGERFTMADCSAAPALFYANKVAPLGAFDNVAAYLRRLEVRPSFARVLEEAGPYFALFPQ